MREDRAAVLRQVEADGAGLEVLRQRARPAVRHRDGEADLDVLAGERGEQALAVGGLLQRDEAVGQRRDRQVGQAPQRAGVGRGDRPQVVRRGLAVVALLEAVEDDLVGTPDRIQRVAVLGDPRLLAAQRRHGVEVALGRHVVLGGHAVDDLGAVGREREPAQVADGGDVELVLGDVVHAHALAAGDRRELLRVGREAERVDRPRAHHEALRAGLELLQHDRVHRGPPHRDGDEGDPAAVGRDRRRAADPEPAGVLPAVLRDIDDGGRRARLLDVDELGLGRRHPQGATEQGHDDRGRAHAHQNTFGGERLCPAWHVRASGSVRPALSRLAIAILDDYQDVARSFAPWGDLDADVTVFTDHVDGRERLARPARAVRRAGRDARAHAVRRRPARPAAAAAAAGHDRDGERRDRPRGGDGARRGRLRDADHARPDRRPHLGADPRAAAAHPRGARQRPLRRLADHGRRRRRTA